jgi:hypothetical protein
MNLSQLKEIIEDIHEEYDINPSFTEKDIYITDILKIMSKIEHDKIIPVFAGGTALHKGHKVIKRFSEDIDFRVKVKSPTTRAERSDIKYYIISKINEIPGIKVIENTIEARNENNFFSFCLEYPKIYSSDKSLRDNIKFEMSFDELVLDTVECEINSIIDNLMPKSPPVLRCATIEEINQKFDSLINIIDKNFKINCISLEETAGNKLSALMWRVQIKDRTKPGGIRNDPTIIRHLHDLSAMKDKVLNDKFILVLEKSFNCDLGRGGSSKTIKLKDSIKNTLNSLKTDRIYNEEYENFVRNMCYGMTKDFISFNKAIEDFEEITKFVLTKNI